MNEILEKIILAPDYKMLIINSPRIAGKILPGQFVILRVHEKGERIPMTVADFDRDKGTLTMVVNEVGKTSKMLGGLEVGDSIPNMLGPLGVPSEIENFGNVVCVCRQGTAGALFSIVKALKEKGNRVTTIMGAKDGDYLIMEVEHRRIVDEVIVATNDGSRGLKGYAVTALKEYLKSNKADYILTIGGTTLMKAVAKVGKEHGIRTVASLGAIMLDGTGMCGACRVTVDGETRFACVHGPEFQADKVDFEELRRRQASYKDQEKLSLTLYEEDS